MVIGGGSGSGKNWTVNNLTDVPNRYKIVDPDAIIDMATKMQPPNITKSLRQYIEQESNEQFRDSLLSRLDAYGIQTFSKSPNEVFSRYMYKFIHDMNYKNKTLTNLTQSILTSAVKPNIAFNGTMRYVPVVIKDIEVLREYGYDVDGKVDCLFVLSPHKQAHKNIQQRAQNVRGVDKKFMNDSRDAFHKNMLKVLNGQSPLTSYIRDVYVVFNAKESITYYHETSVIKDFKYMKIKPHDTEKIEQLESIISDYE